MILIKRLGRMRINNFERLCNVASSRKIIGNIWEHPELAEVKE